MSKGGAILTFAAIAAIGTLVFFLATLIYFLNFKVQIFQYIMEEYHYNKVQEIPLALISSDFNKESFVEKFNKAYYGFYSEDEFKDFVSCVRKNITAQVGEKYFLVIRSSGLSFGTPFYEGCRVVTGTIYGGIKECKCSDECPCHNVNGEDICPVMSTLVGRNCEDVLPVTKCYRSLFVINITYINETFPLPLVFNGTNFTTTMKFEAYA